MDKSPGWLPDPERQGQERYWSGSDWTDRVRPAGKGRSLHLPEHVPELQRALAAATADIDAVEDRLSTLFDRNDDVQHPTTSRQTPPPAPPPAAQDGDDEEIPGLYDEDVGVEDDAIHAEFVGATAQGGDGLQEDGDDDGAFTELDAALVAEEPEQVEPEGKRGFFRRRS